MYTTLMISTGLTFGSISALFGLTDHIIDQVQYTILLTAVIGSAVVPTLIAQIGFGHISNLWRKKPSPCRAYNKQQIGRRRHANSERRRPVADILRRK